MSDFPSFKELFEIAKEEILQKNPAITEDIIDREGSDANIIVASIAAMGEEIINQLSLLSNALLLSTATEDDLDRLCFDWYGITRKSATASTVRLKFYRTVSGTVIIIPARTKCQTIEGIEFSTLGDAKLEATALEVFIDAVCTEAGNKGNVKAGTIKKIIGSFDNINVINPKNAGGGADRENDDELRGRARDFFTTVRRGTLSAIEYGAKQVVGVSKAKAIEKMDGGVPGRYIELVISDNSGSYSSKLISDVKNELEKWRALGIYIAVFGADLVYVNVEIRLSFKAGYDTIEAQERVRNNVITYINNLGIGERLRRAGLIETIAKIEGIDWRGEEGLIKPVGDIVPTNVQILRTDKEYIKFI